jgi:hypothetical protein
MDRAFPMRRRMPRLRGLGYPILPDQFTTAAGVSESFSPQTADATMIAILQSQGQQLPADLAAKMAAAQTVTPATQVPSITTSPVPVTTANPTQSPANPAPGAVSPSGQPISTQTAAPVSLAATIAIAPGVWQCVMSDGSSHYCDGNANPISYTPPAPAPATTPAASSQPAAPVTVIAVTPAGGQISTTTGTTAPLTTPAAVSSSFVDEAMAWLQQSMIAGIPNWVLLGGGAALLLMSGDGKGSRRR